MNLKKYFVKLTNANIAQSVERKPFKLVVVGSSPTVGICPCGAMVSASVF